MSIIIQTWEFVQGILIKTYDFFIKDFPRDAYLPPILIFTDFLGHLFSQIAEKCGSRLVILLVQGEKMR